MERSKENPKELETILAEVNEQLELIIQNIKAVNQSLAELDKTSSNIEIKIAEKFSDVISRLAQTTALLNTLTEKMNHIPEDIHRGIVEKINVLQEKISNMLESLEISNTEKFANLEKQLITLANQVTSISNIIDILSLTTNSEFRIIDQKKKKIVTDYKLSRGKKYKFLYKNGYLLTNKDSRVHLKFSSNIYEFMGLSTSKIEMQKDTESMYYTAEIVIKKPSTKLEALRTFLKKRGIIEIIINNTTVDVYPIVISGLDYYFLVGIGSIVFFVMNYITTIYPLNLLVLTSVPINLISIILIIWGLLEIKR